jgi:uncharacterized protein YwgA
MNDRIVSDVAYSLLSRAERDRLQIGTTRLVKLLYLIDCDYFKWKRETLTGAAWVFYHYGPYSAELIDVVNRARGLPSRSWTTWKTDAHSVDIRFLRSEETL